MLTGDVVDVAAAARAYGSPLAGRGVLRSEPADFLVEECCDVDFDSAGEHVWVHVEKVDWTTPQLAEAWARALGIAPRMVGYSGLKDRHALTRQWLSFPWPIKQALPDWPALPGCRVLAAHRHGRKLRRGTHRANRFAIRVRETGGLDEARLATRVAQLRAGGVPNYFGPQRFGRGGRNIALSRALFDGRRMSRARRGFALSAARALLFNCVLDARIRAGAWPGPLPGDVFMLDGSRSLFASDADAADHADLVRRVGEGDIHPTGPLPGRTDEKALRPSGPAGDMERGVLADWAAFVAGLARAGVAADRRPLRVAVDDLEVRAGQDDLHLSFALPPGAYATSIIRELVDAADARSRPVDGPD